MKTSLLFASLLLLAACASPLPAETATLTVQSSPTASITPSVTASPFPSPTATPVVIPGTLTMKVNLRSGPGTTFDSLAQLEAGSTVQVTARDASGTWLQVLHPSAQGGRAWVSAEYVSLPAGAQVPLDATPTPEGPVGELIQPLNVRSGPGTSFESLGLLPAGTVVALTGKNATSSWFQVLYPAAPGGRAWLTSQYVQTDATAVLPILDEFGNPVTGPLGGTPGPYLSPTPTTGPAFLDGDSSTSPGAAVVFSTASIRLLTYSSQVSSPDGDEEDWVAFTPYASAGTEARLDFSLACTAGGNLAVELWQGSTRLDGWGSLACRDSLKSIHLPAGETYLLRLTVEPGEDLVLVAYTLTIQNNP